jgi:integrase
LCAIPACDFLTADLCDGTTAMPFTVNVTKRERTRRLKSGARVTQTRWVVNYKEPRTGQRRQLFFEKKAEAHAKRNELLASVETGTYSEARTHITVAAAIENWLEHRRSEVKTNTFRGYGDGARLIVKPLLIGATAQQRETFTKTGEKPGDAKFAPLLGGIKINELSTADIRAWHKLIVQEVGAYSANRAKMFLNAALRLAEEDLRIRACAMPLYLGKAKQKTKKAILTTEQVARLVAAARQDQERGIYYAFPFLCGTRPSEQLALLWEDVCFSSGVIQIRRMQERDGSITALTKTEAGTREVPMGPMLKSMLLEWRLLCPRLNGELHRVFPGPGRTEKDGQRIGVGGPIQYQNFRSRVWAKAFKKLGLPYISPHAARHQWISTMQAQGIEVGLVAKLAGHANANITLSHYTQAVRNGDAAVKALEDAYAL